MHSFNALILVVCHAFSPSIKSVFSTLLLNHFFMVLHYALAYDSYMILADWFTIMDVSVPVHMIRLLLILTKSMHHSMYYLSAMCSRSTPRVLIIAAVS